MSKKIKVINRTSGANNKDRASAPKTPDRTRGQLIRSVLLGRGYTLRAWAKKNGYALTTVWQAAYRLRAGKTAVKINAQLEKILNA